MNNIYDGPSMAEADEQGLKDEWEPLAAQIDYWADLDKEYWRQRRETEYRLFLERKYGVATR